MKRLRRYIRDLCLRRRLYRLVDAGATLIELYAGWLTTWGCTATQLEQAYPWVVKYRLDATHCARRARRIARRLGIPLSELF